MSRDERRDLDDEPDTLPFDPAKLLGERTAEPGPRMDRAEAPDPGPPDPTLPDPGPPEAPDAPLDRDGPLELDESLYELTVEPVRYEPARRRRRAARLPSIACLDDEETGVCDPATMVRLRARARAELLAKRDSGDEPDSTGDGVGVAPPAPDSGVRAVDSVRDAVGRTGAPDVRPPPAPRRGR